MKRLTFVLALAAGLVAGNAPAVAAQGLQTGTLSGAVRDQQGLVLPGVTVTASSPALQGVRVATTDANGLYTMPALPPGTYAVQFELQGMRTVTRRETLVPLGGVAAVDATMGIGGVEEVVQVRARIPSVLLTPTGQTNVTASDIDTLPVGRTPARIAELAPGLTDNTPNPGQVTISGALAYDNVFMIDGVDVNENIFGTANNVFIEDAIDEVQVLTSGIGAEYGRFSGGVVNLVTKSGGNTFSGSGRLNLSNPAWSDESPLEKSRGTEHVSKLSKFFEATLGGPVMRDRLWFFAATRRERSDVQNALAQVGTPVVTNIENDRYEIKLTGTPAPSHTLQGSYIDNKTAENNRASLNIGLSLDSNVLIDRQNPNSLFVTSYNGVAGSRTFINAQYSQKRFGLRNNGGTSTALADSPFRSRGALGVPGGLHYHAPYLSALDPEDRNNRQLAGSVAYFLTSRDAGSHNLKVGGEHFTSTLVGGNSQSATGYVFLSDYRTTATGAPALDAQGRVTPRFVPGLSQVQNWMSTPGARIDIKTVSLYGQDNWAVSNRLSVDLGFRFESVTSEATGDIVGADTTTIVPRLGLSFDPTGDGKSVVQATYGHYSGRYGEAQFVRNTDVGTPSRVTYTYTGPEGEGFDFAPGMDLANYAAVASGSFPTANVFFADSLSSPLTKEFTLSTGRDFGRGYGRVMYTWRRASGFIEDHVDDPSADGKVTVIRNGVNFGVFDRVEYRNSDDVWREYQGLQFLGRYNAAGNLTVNGHYTVQLKNHGNFEGEATNQPGLPSDVGNYPEILSARSFPEGRLNDFQRHKVRVWAIYSHDLGRAGSIDLAPMWRYNSALTYSLAVAPVMLTPAQIAANPGYARPPGGGFQLVHFGDRGTEEFAGYGLVDLAASYQVPVWRALRPWVKFEMLNVLNNDKLIGWNTAITPDPSSQLDAVGLPTGYLPAAGFGTARNNADYPRPLPGIDGGRTFQVALGLRF
jgi:hypothetical protein